MKRVCLVTTSPLIVNFFLVPYLLSLKRTYQVTLIVNAAEGTPLEPLPDIRVVSMPVLRKMAPFSDMAMLFRLVWFFLRERFDLVHSFSPKAGLLAIVAAKIAGIPHRVHTYTGQVWSTRRGLMRWMLREADRAIARAATHLLADSVSQREFLGRHGVVSADRCEVLGWGSVSGVDVRRFRPDPEARARVRAELNIPLDATVVLFLGRVTREKGIPELVDAFSVLAERRVGLYLLIVGPDEDELTVSIAACKYGQRVRILGYSRRPEHYVAASDVLALPSHREGFGTVILEAAAAGVPTVAARIYGVTDAVVDGQTGLLHKPGDVRDLVERLARVVDDADFRARLGACARERALEEFSQERLTSELMAFYARVLRQPL